MTSKVLVKLPVVPFSQGKLKSAPNEQIISLSDNRNDDDKVSRLEQNMKFLQQQHKATLVALYQEVELLRQRNRDLQFQLVFSSSGEEGNANVSKGTAELEKELLDVKSCSNETKKRNAYLAQVVEKQKKRIEMLEKTREKPKCLDIGLQVDRLLECQQVELQVRLDEMEALVKRLRQESEQQRREIEKLRVEQGEQDQQFPPLQTQSYWHRATRGKQSRGHHRQKQQLSERVENLQPEADGILPQLRNGSVRVDNSLPLFYRSRSHHCSNYYKDERPKYKKPQRRQQNFEFHHQNNHYNYNNHQESGPSSSNHQRPQRQRQYQSRDFDSHQRESEKSV